MHMKNKYSKATKGIVVNGVHKTAKVPKKPRKNRIKLSKNHQLILGGGVISLVIVCSVIWLSIVGPDNYSVYDLPDKNIVSTEPAQDESPVVTPSAEVSELTGKIAAYPDNPRGVDRVELADLYIGLGAAYSNLGRGDKAIAAYQQASKYSASDQERAILAGKAYAYEVLGQTDQTVKAYQDLIAYIEDNPNPFSSRDADNYRLKIETLKNSGQQ